MINQQLIDWKTAINDSRRLRADCGSRWWFLETGATADIVIIDPDASWKVDGNHFRSHCISSPLDGEQLHGRATHTIVGGEIRYRLNPDLDHLA